MPIYGQNAIVLACKSDNLAPTNVAAGWASDKTLTSQQLTYSFTGGQIFATHNNYGNVAYQFSRGAKVWIDSARISIPNLQGLVNSNTTVFANAPLTAWCQFKAENGVDVSDISNNVAFTVTSLMEWIPISQLSCRTGLTSAGIYFTPQKLVVDVDFRNVDLTVFDALTTYAYLELKVYAAAKP